MSTSFSAFVLALGIGLALFCTAPISRAQDTYFGSRGSAGIPPKTVSPPIAVSSSSPVSTVATLSAKDIKIVASVWGSETKFVDVTERVADALNHPGTEHEVGPDWLRADPAPGWKKVMVTIFEVNGVRYVMGNHEGIKIDLHKFQEHVQGNLATTKKP